MSAKKELLLLENEKKDFQPKMKRLQSKEFIDNRIDEYVDGFTVHGLTKVFRAQRKEACFWLVFILIGLMFAGVVIGRLVFKYYRFETYTEVRAVVTDKNILPSVSVCDMSALQKAYFSYCGERISFNKSQTHECDWSKVPQTTNQSNVDGAGSWYNSLFEVNHCLLWSGLECKTTRYIKSTMNGACFTWNYDGSLYDTYGHLELQFKYLGSGSGSSGAKEGKKTPTPTPPKIVVIPHDHKISEIDLTRKFSMDPHVTYEVTVGKTMHIRKPHPYSECTTQAGISELDVFPGGYSRRTCIESYKMMEAYKHCGDIFDYFKSFLPDHIKRKYQQNRTIYEVSKCIAQNLDAKVPKGHCPFACEELGLSTSSNTFKSGTVQDTDDKTLHYYIELQLENVDSYTVMREQPLYSAEQMSAEIGGFLGLVAGASLLSFVELIACGWLFVVKKVFVKK